MQVNPPISMRKFHWCAHLDDYGAPDAGYQPRGFGETEAEAIKDLAADIEDHLEDE